MPMSEVTNALNEKPRVGLHQIETGGSDRSPTEGVDGNTA